MGELTAEQIAAYRHDLQSGGKAARRAFAILSARWAAWMQAIAGGAGRRCFVQGWREIRPLLRHVLTPFLPEQATVAKRLRATRNAMWERRDAWETPDDQERSCLERICAIAIEGLWPQAAAFATLSDAQLMTLTKYAYSGDAYSLLYRKHTGPAYGWCRKRNATHEMAEDVIQQAFLRTWSSRQTYRDGAPFSPFFYTVLLHAFLHALDHAPDRATAAQVLETFFTGVADPAAQFLVQELSQQVRQCVSSLPDVSRAAVERWMQGRSYANIATELGMHLSGVKRRMLAAFRNIRECLRTTLEDA